MAAPPHSIGSVPKPLPREVVGLVRPPPPHALFRGTRMHCAQPQRLHRPDYVQHAMHLAAALAQESSACLAVVPTKLLSSLGFVFRRFGRCSPLVSLGRLPRQASLNKRHGLQLGGASTVAAWTCGTPAEGHLADSCLAIGLGAWASCQGTSGQPGGANAKLGCVCVALAVGHLICLER